MFFYKLNHEYSISRLSHLADGFLYANALEKYNYKFFFSLFDL